MIKRPTRHAMNFHQAKIFDPQNLSETLSEKRQEFIFKIRISLSTIIRYNLVRFTRKLLF